VVIAPTAVEPEPPSEKGETFATKVDRCEWLRAAISQNGAGLPDRDSGRLVATP